MIGFAFILSSLIFVLPCIIGGFIYLGLSCIISYVILEFMPFLYTSPDEESSSKTRIFLCLLIGLPIATYKLAVISISNGLFSEEFLLSMGISDLMYFFIMLFFWLSIGFTIFMIIYCIRNKKNKLLFFVCLVIVLSVIGRANVYSPKTVNTYGNFQVKKENFQNTVALYKNNKKLVPFGEYISIEKIEGTSYFKAGKIKTYGMRREVEFGVINSKGKLIIPCNQVSIDLEDVYNISK